MRNTEYARLVSSHASISPRRVRLIGVCRAFIVRRDSTPDAPVPHFGRVKTRRYHDRRGPDDDPECLTHRSYGVISTSGQSPRVKPSSPKKLSIRSRGTRPDAHSPFHNTAPRGRYQWFQRPDGVAGSLCACLRAHKRLVPASFRALIYPAADALPARIAGSLI